MEERQGWERPGWFHLTNKVNVMPYKETRGNQIDQYRDVLENEYNFQLSPYDSTVSIEN